MKKKMLLNMDLGIFICSVLLLAIGLVALFSATQNTEYEEFKKQIMWALISVPVMIIVVIIDYEFIAKLSPIFYGICILLLIGVFFTEPINGATSWYILGSTSFQPGEVSKIFVIIFASAIMTMLTAKGRERINKPWVLGIIVLIIGVPTLLIAKQPDLGTAIAYIMAFSFMIFVSEIKLKYIFIIVLIVIIAVPTLYFTILPAHAKTRIDIFLNPEQDPRGAGYNIIQSKLAIGAGGLTGMGMNKGNQTQLGFLYPKTTDFIFAVIGEEFGFIVTSLIVVIYVVMITKSIYVAKTAKDELGAYIAMGIAGVFFFHMIENIGMTIGLLPITGVPLPFVSYGGSSMITNFICIGMLLNISGRRQKAIFIG